MSSSMETIGHKLQSLEERLQAENKSHENLITNATTMVVPGTTTSATAGYGNPIGITTTMGSSSGIGNMTSGTIKQPPKSLQTTPNRPRRMYLPVIAKQPEAIETDRMLKKIMKQNGILTINGIPYPTDIKDLEHLGDLGNGTSGNVVKMCHKPSGKIIAVKQMRRTGNTEENKRILMDLDVVLKSHGCNYIVQCLGCFVRDADVWICMELMSMCFDKLLKLSKKPVPEDILGKVTVATAKALAYLKEKHDVIHRDVKPSNILIDERGNIKLCDFGISGRLVDSKANTRSAGCAAYMAPERIDPKKPKYDVRADVWSLGITLVELATTRSPYHGCLTDFEVLTKVLESDPPSLPRGDGFNFTEEFHDFVRKCLTKDHNKRPKYPELLEQPFIKLYEIVNVDVAQWFKTTVETAGIKTYSRVTPTTTDILGINYLKNGLPNNAVIPAPAIATSSIKTINNKLVAATTTTHIPTYQQKNAIHQHLQHYNHHNQNQNQNQHQQQSIIQSQLPQATGNYYGQQQLQIVDRGGGVTGRIGGGGGGGSGSSSATSSSPLSPPSISYQTAKDQATITNEMHNLYRKSSPFLQRKYSNGANYKYTDESPKKESMFSSFGQTILRNLTTSPFSQKKHTQTNATMLPTQNIDPLWRMPISSTATTIKEKAACLPYDSYDVAALPAPTKSPPLQNIVNSPAMARKRFQAYDAKFNKELPLQQLPAQQQIGNSLIPINKHEVQSQRVQGNQSPIVLQRFYHQQNQLREKELERQKHQQQQQTQLEDQWQHRQNQQQPQQQQLTQLEDQWQHRQNQQQPQQQTQLEDQWQHRQNQQQPQQQTQLEDQWQHRQNQQQPQQQTQLEDQWQHRQNQQQPQPQPEQQFRLEDQWQQRQNQQQPQPQQQFRLEDQWQHRQNQQQPQPQQQFRLEDQWQHRQNQQQPQRQQREHSPEVVTTNPFLSTYIPPSGSTTTSQNYHYQHQQQQQQQQLQQNLQQHHYSRQQHHSQYLQSVSHIPIAATTTLLSSAASAISSSHSTSSQSSTQSSNSQIAITPNTYGGVQCNPTKASNDANSATLRETSSPPILTTSAFGGIGAVQLQYQPLPQQCIPSLQNSLRKSRSPPISPEPEPIIVAGGGGDDGSDSSKLNKIYARRQLQATTACNTNSSITNNSQNGSGAAARSNKEFRTTAEHGWFNTITGAMKRQFASYAKLQLNSLANGSTIAATTTAATSSTLTTPNQADEKPKTLSYYRTISASSSSNNTSSSTSPTESVPNKNNLANDFHDGGTSSFLRRYAVTGGSGTSSASPHVLANLDRRHRSPDPPPRYNRGQSPLLLRKNLLELSGQQQIGSPLLNRRYVSASPPLPPPRRGSESVPGSPQHFRTRIHYTPEPQRRIYRAVDQ